jgi:gas vesicle protein
VTFVDLAEDIISRPYLKPRPGHSSNFSRKEPEMLKRNALESFGLILTGMAIGATVAVLFAPESGTRTRKRLGKYARRTAEDLWEQGQEAMETAADRGKEYLETGKEKAKEAAQKAAETVKENILRQTG